MLGCLCVSVQKELADALADDEANAGHDAGAEGVEEDGAEIGGGRAQQVLEALGFASGLGGRGGVAGGGWGRHGRMDGRGEAVGGSGQVDRWGRLGMDEGGGGAGLEERMWSSRDANRESTSAIRRSRFCA